MKELFEGHLEGCRKGGQTQSEMMYECPKCDSIGYTNKMVSHIKTCDGTGFKNYHSKKRSEALIELRDSLPLLF